MYYITHLELLYQVFQKVKVAMEMIYPVYEVMYLSYKSGKLINQVYREYGIINEKKIC